jgi:protein-S-isoprenylcysteine O-methyltransferase Ste14
MNTKKDKGPAVKVPPPVIFLAFILLAWWLNDLVPLRLKAAETIISLGWLFCIASFLLACASVYQFVKARTHIEPWKPADALIISGVFRFSRNPIYLAFVLFTFGLGLVMNNLWVVLSIMPSIAVLHRWVIIKEERYLSSRFGKEYRDYCNNVRRWL